MSVLTVATNVPLVLGTPLLAASEGGANPFAGSIYQGIAAVLVFLILLAVLYKMAWGPILKGLQDREGKIKEDLESAERASAEARKKAEEYDRKLAEAQTEARSVIEQARGDAEKVAADLKAQTQREIDAMRERAQADIRAAKEQALSEIYAQAAELSTQIAGRILRREINADDQRRLVEESLAELAKSE